MEESQWLAFAHILTKFKPKAEVRVAEYKRSVLI